MDDFEKKDLILSLIFPVLTFLWGAAEVVTPLMFGGRWTFDALEITLLVLFLAGVSGGILSALLTILLRINTSMYFLKRLAVVGVVCLIHQVIISFTTGPMIVLLIAGIGGVVYQIMRVQNEDTTPRQRVVWTLSDPLVYWSVHWFILQLVLDV